MKAMISQPMAGRTEKEIAETREKAKAFLESKGYDFVNTKFDVWYPPEDTKNIPLAFLAKSLESMSKCDTVYFCDGWMGARGCHVEYMAANYYDLDIIYENEEEQEISERLKEDREAFGRMTPEEVLEDIKKELTEHIKELLEDEAVECWEVRANVDK